MDCPLNQAMQSTLGVLMKVQPRDLTAATPCVSWDVRALVNHFIGTAHWWAAAVTRGTGPASDDEPADVDYAAGDFVGAYEEGVRIAVTAFAAEGVLDSMVRLPFGEVPRHRRAGYGGDGSVRPWLGPSPRHRIPRRPGSRTRGPAARPRQGRDHRRVPRSGRAGSIRSRGTGARRSGSGRSARRFPWQVGVIGAG
jgi:Mycothiol maleylpyruvate isomerase N-terminal domain.